MRTQEKFPPNLFIYANFLFQLFVDVLVEKIHGIIVTVNNNSPYGLKISPNEGKSYVLGVGRDRFLPRRDETRNFVQMRKEFEIKSRLLRYSFRPFEKSSRLV